LAELEPIKFKPVILISTQVVDAQRISIEVADNDMAIRKDITAQLSAPLLVAKPAAIAISSGLALSYRIIVEQHK